MNLEAARLNKGMSLTEAASAIGISKTTLQRAEAGAMPRASVAKKIADFFGVTVTAIWPVADRSAA